MSLGIPRIFYKSATTRLSRSLAASRHKATMAPQFSQENSDLIADLHKLSSSQPKLVKSTTYAAPADPNITIRSWKMNEFKYYDIPSPFPTLARGLFTTEWPVDEADGGKKYQIVVRGYDKFFNIGEVPWTKVGPIVFCLACH
jgi:tRNA ligase